MSESKNNDYFPKYPKIDTIFKRTDKGAIVPGCYSRPEFKALEKIEWEVFEKIDGTNIRIKWDGEGYEVRGRTDKAQIPEGLLKEIDRLIDVSKFREVLGDKVVILYGEGYGANIQRKKTGPLYSESYNFILFDVLVGDIWLSHDSILSIGFGLGINVVSRLCHAFIFPDVNKPVYCTCPNPNANANKTFYSDVVGMCKNGFKSRVGDVQAEGVIIKPPLGLKDRKGKRIIAKLKCSDFFK